MKTRVILSLIITAACIIISCGRTPSLINSEIFNTSNLKSFTTYRIVMPDSVNRLPEGMDKNMYMTIVRNIRTQMSERGFTENPKSTLMINMGFSVQNEDAGPFAESNIFMPGKEEEAVPDCCPYFVSPRQKYWSETDGDYVDDIYKPGVMTMDVVNTVENAPVYTSSASTAFDIDDYDSNADKEVTTAVAILFSQFPVLPI